MYTIKITHMATKRISTNNLSKSKYTNYFFLQLSFFLFPWISRLITYTHTHTHTTHMHAHRRTHARTYIYKFFNLYSCFLFFFLFSLFCLHFSLHFYTITDKTEKNMCTKTIKAWNKFSSIGDFNSYFFVDSEVIPR
jgi:hypothetical protein